MSVFKKLKGTFQHAQQDIVDGIRALTSLDNQTRHDQHRSLTAREINLDTGADLLNHYQKNWSSIQTETRDSAKRAEEAATLMAPLFQIWEKHAASITQLEGEVKIIPTIQTMLTQLHTLLNDLSQSVIATEKGLEMLENLCDEQQFQKSCLEEQRKLAMYKVKKEAEAERIKVELAQSHAKKMVELESAKKKSLQERADAFTSAFQNDLDFYRVHGHPGRIPTEFPKVSSLSDIQLDQDKQALDSFLGPNGETDGSTGSLELSGEGAYIEDDYTTDFSVKQDMDFQEDSNYTSAAVISQLEIDSDENYNHQQDTTILDLPECSDDECRDVSENKIDNFSLSDNPKVSPSDIEQENQKKKQESTGDAEENFATSSQNTDAVET